MKILALDTATEACSAALYNDGALSALREVAPREHGNLILPMIESLLGDAGLTPAGLDGVAFGRGPGAFTGVRIAVGVAQGIGYAAGLPLVPVSDLAAVALAAHRRHGADRVLVCLDARMKEVYWCEFECGSGHCVPLGDERLGDPASVRARGAVFAAGPGWAAYPALAERLAGTVTGTDPGLLPDAADIARLALPALKRGETVAPEEAQPVYLRDEVAWKKP